MEADKIIPPPPLCPVCLSHMDIISKDYSICPKCRYMSSQLVSGLSLGMAEDLSAVREKNFNHICRLIKKRFPQKETILDVGCAKGMFLKIAGNAGYTVTGLEPNEQFVQEIRSRGETVINGFFPDVVALSNKTFDVIIFNDSIEHIPDLEQVVKGIKDHLADNGIVIINIPTSDGLIFQMTYLLNKFGINKPFDRLWQKNYSSPHIHYFNKNNLKLFFAKNGFSQISCMTSPHYTIKGLWKRISRTYSVFTTFFIWFFMVLLYPIFRIKSNSILVIFLYDPGIAQ